MTCMRFANCSEAEAQPHVAAGFVAGRSIFGKLSRNRPRYHSRPKQDREKLTLAVVVEIVLLQFEIDS